MLRKFVIRTGLAALTWMCAHLAHAAPLFVNFDNFTYSGSVTRYATLEDARNDISPTGGPPLPTDVTALSAFTMTGVGCPA